MPGAVDYGLKDRKVLVVEDDWMLATEVAAMLADLGAEALGPVGNLPDALRLAVSEARIDGAVLDVNVQGQKTWPVADALRARGVPLVFATGYDAQSIPAAYVGVERCEKPATVRALAGALSRAMSGSPVTRDA